MNIDVMIEHFGNAHMNAVSIPYINAKESNNNLEGGGHARYVGGYFVGQGGG
jgi:hypothetical protein